MNRMQNKTAIACVALERGRHASGISASMRTSAAQHDARVAAICSNRTPRGAKTLPVTSAMIPRQSMPVTRGAASKLATGDMSGNCANCVTVIGSVADDATMVAATDETRLGGSRGSACPSQQSASLAKMMSPSTESTESWNPREKAMGGERPRKTSAHRDSALSAEARVLSAPQDKGNRAHRGGTQS